MANIVPPIPPSAAGSLPSNLAAPGALPTLTVSNPPPGLAQVAIGTAFQGTILAADPAGATPGIIGIQTPIGILNVSSNLTFPNNAILTLLLQTLTPQARLLITAINGQPPAQTLQTQPGGLPTAPGTPIASAPTPSVSVGTAPVITATVLPNTSSSAQPATTTQPTPPITAATAATAAIGVLAQLVKSAATKVGLPNTVGAPTLATPPPSGNVPGHPQAAYSAGTQIPVRVLNLQPAVSGASTPTLPTLSPTPLSSGQTLTGIITGLTPAGHTIVQTSAGQLSIAIAEPAPPGSSITLEIAGRPLTPALLNTSPTSALDLFSLSREWPALKEALQALQETQPGIAQQLISMVIPRLDAQLAANMLFFMLALRGGDIRNWLGEEPMRALENTHPELGRQLRAEFGQLARIAEDPASGDWRQMLIPFNTGDAVEAIHMFMRQRKKQKDSEGDTETRFVIDVGLTQLGRVQLDGLIGEKNKRLDLIIRSGNPLPSTMQNDIRMIFINAGEITGMNGGLSFQAAPANFVEIPTLSLPKNSSTGIIA